MGKPSFTTMQAQTSRFRLYAVLLYTVIGLVLIVEAFCGFKIHQLSGEQLDYRKDYSIVNSVSFGLLSVDLWRDQIISAASAEMKQYRLTPSQQADLKKEIEGVLHGLVDTAFAMINKPQRSIGGKLKKMVIKTLVDKESIQKQVPGYAHKIMAEVTKPSSYQRLQRIADTALAQMGKKTYDSSMAVTRKLMDSVFAKYAVNDKASFEAKNTAILKQIKKDSYAYCYGMMGCIVLVLICWWIVRKQAFLHIPLYLMSVLAALILLLVGLTTTMIEIDAQIASMDFHLLGQNVTFKHQELFFQSKSILDVVMLLLQTGKFESQVVGILILVFSVVFPFLKLLSTALALMSEHKLAKNRLVHFFAFESGKWSMADVMVVAILMTFIGFNGIVNNTLADLNINDESITSITTNNTSIQPGYIIFICFVLYGFVLSIILKKITRQFTRL